MTEPTAPTASGCRDARELMLAAVDDELRGRDRAGFETHVAGCEACTRELERTRRLAAALDGLSDETAVPVGFEAAVVARARETLRSGRPGGRPARGWVAWSVRGLAAAAALVLGVGIWQQRWREEPAAPKPPPRETAVETRAPARTARESGQQVPQAVLRAPRRFLDLPVIERMEMLQYLQRRDALHGDADPRRVERG